MALSLTAATDSDEVLALICKHAPRGEKKTSSGDKQTLWDKQKLVLSQFFILPTVRHLKEPFENLCKGEYLACCLQPSAKKNKEEGSSSTLLTVLMQR